LKYRLSISDGTRQKVSRLAYAQDNHDAKITHATATAAAAAAAATTTVITRPQPQAACVLQLLPRNTRPYTYKEAVYMLGVDVYAFNHPHTKAV
jgi:hypothetical protein